MEIDKLKSSGISKSVRRDIIDEIFREIKLLKFVEISKNFSWGVLVKQKTVKFENHVIELKFTVR